jgi:hypothetical protein
MKVAVVYAAKSTEDKTRFDPDAAGGLPPPRRARGLAGRRRVQRRGVLGIRRQPWSEARTGEGLAAETAAKSGCCIVIAQDADVPSHVPVARRPAGGARRPMGLREVDLRRTQRADGPLGRDAEQLALEAAREEGEADRAYVPRPVGGR